MQVFDRVSDRLSPSGTFAFIRPHTPRFAPCVHARLTPVSFRRGGSSQALFDIKGQAGAMALVIPPERHCSGYVDLRTILALVLSR